MVLQMVLQTMLQVTNVRVKKINLVFTDFCIYLHFIISIHIYSLCNTVCNMEEKEGKNNKNGTDASNGYSPKPFFDLLKKAAKENNEAVFEMFAQMFVEAEAAKEELRRKGYGHQGLSLLRAVVDEVPNSVMIIPEKPNTTFGHLKRVRLNPECYKRHYPPHRPWYVMPKYDSLGPGLADLEWIVAECPGNPELYLVYFGNRKYYIEKKDCI